MSKKESRRAERIRAFQILYGLNFSDISEEADLKRAFVQSPDPEGEAGIGAKPEGFAWELVHGVWRDQDELDRLVTSLSKHWKINRIARIELTILRLSLYEMTRRDDIPPKVAINEGVELAKLFGDDNSKSFVNGILDAAAKAVDNGTLGVC